MEDNFVIGVLGGMGTYATINLFRQYAEVFPAEKEWERPRIVIDNRCTMPSRVRAFLYNENVEKLIDEMSDSMKHLVDSGCTKIILACNTSHLFLPKIYEKVPELRNKVMNIIDNCIEEIKNDGADVVYLLGSEGTIESRIYQSKLEQNGIKCLVPEPKEYGLLRECIEAVKQNKYTDEIQNKFSTLVNRYDPLLLALQKLKKEYDND